MFSTSAPTKATKAPPPRQPFHKRFHFFYGPLQDPSTLSQVLELRDPPVLVPAKLTGYRCKPWKGDLALVDGEPDEVVRGMAYEVQSHQEELRLLACERGHNMRAGCTMELEDGERVRGNMLKWYGQQDEKGELKEGDVGVSGAEENIPKGCVLSPMARKFRRADLQGYTTYSPPSQPLRPFRREFHFFYGTLQDPQTLAKVLELRELPDLVPAKITGYRCKLWGEYPALVDRTPGAGEVVCGMAYEVQSPEEVKRLEDYETRHYVRVGCMIEFEDGSEVAGNTFRWYGVEEGEEEELKEGGFDLKDWKMGKLEREMGGG